MFAFEKFKPNTIILDDGFQHRGLYRDVDILTMDAANPSGSDHLLPRGLLREPHRNMKRAKAIVFTRVDDPADRECSERTVRYYNKKIPLFFTRLDMAGLHEPGTGKQEPVSVLAGKKIAALSTIANPESFHKLLIKTGAQIVYTRIRPDHHRHTSGEMAEVIGKAGSSGAEYLVMTGKDERNLPAGMVPDTLKVRVLDIRAVLMEKEQDYLSMILPHGVGRIKG
jgi:tetraacyldisaccharide 4'-kinase